MSIDVRGLYREIRHRYEEVWSELRGKYLPTIRDFCRLPGFRLTTNHHLTRIVFDNDVFWIDDVDPRIEEVIDFAKEVYSIALERRKIIMRIGDLKDELDYYMRARYSYPLIDKTGSIARELDRKKDTIEREIESLTRKLYDLDLKCIELQKPRSRLRWFAWWLSKQYVLFKHKIGSYWKPGWIMW